MDKKEQKKELKKGAEVKTEAKKEWRIICLLFNILKNNRIYTLTLDAAEKINLIKNPTFIITLRIR